MMAPKRKVRRPPLEVRSHVDGAWYDADISFEGFRLRVHFNGFGSEDDEFWEQDYLRSTVRIMEIMRLRSKQLQDSQCTIVSVGMIVCANFKTTDGVESKYYDAKILMIQPNQHSFQKGREFCTCRFKLAWEDGPYKHKEVYLRCADISLIDDESVEIHLVAREVLQAARAQEEELKDAMTEEPQQVLPSIEDVEVNCVDILPDDVPSESESKGLVMSREIEWLPSDVVEKVKNCEIFHDFLGKQADNLKEAIDMYNATNNFLP